MKNSITIKHVLIYLSIFLLGNLRGQDTLIVKNENWKSVYDSDSLPLSKDSTYFIINGGNIIYLKNKIYFSTYYDNGLCKTLGQVFISYDLVNIYTGRSKIDSSEFTLKYYYIKCVYNGKYFEFWDNGSLKTKGKFKNGKKTGKWRNRKIGSHFLHRD